MARICWLDRVEELELESLIQRERGLAVGRLGAECWSLGMIPGDNLHLRNGLYITLRGIMIVMPWAFELVLMDLILSVLVGVSCADPQFAI